MFSTAVTSLKPEDAFDPNRVKCVVDNHGYAIYFSRGLIPYNKWVLILFSDIFFFSMRLYEFVCNCSYLLLCKSKSFVLTMSRLGKVNPQFPYLLHLGIQVLNFKLFLIEKEEHDIRHVFCWLNLLYANCFQHYSSFDLMTWVKILFKERKHPNRP